MKKNYILIAIVIIITVGGALLLYSNKEFVPIEEEFEDEVSQILINLKNETKINFSDIKSVEIEWNKKGTEQPIETLIIQGKGFEIKGATVQDHTKAEDFFKNNGFEIDVYNVAAGTIGGLTGFRREQIVCIVIGSLWTDDEGIPLKTGETDIEVNCGKAEGSLEPVFTLEEVLKKLFAEKYNKKSAEVTIKIAQETESHAKGAVEFQPGGSENSGFFLAAKINEEWHLVFDGNGSFSCETLKQYNFPEGMTGGCY
jgi:hypothetical protein